MQNTKQTKEAYTRTWEKFLIRGGAIGLSIGAAGALMIALASKGSPTEAACWAWIAILLPAAGAIAGILRARHLVLHRPGDLTDWQIALLEKDGVVSPFDHGQIEPDSYDVLLGTEYSRVGKNGTMESWSADEAIVAPGECLLAHTLETFRFPANLKGTLQGKSSWARLALFVECAGLFDKGFVGTAVLELYNASPNPILLKRGDKIAQMSFHRTLPATFPYGHQARNSHYQEQAGAKGSWLTKEDRIVKTKM
jgi:deoxycytidine triphosphate deaminase